jgi:hypothetical protein
MTIEKWKLKTDGLMTRRNLSVSKSSIPSTDYPDGIEHMGHFMGHADFTDSNPSIPDP